MKFDAPTSETANGIERPVKNLGYNFVLVGDRTYHSQNIMDFKNAKQALAYIGL